MHSSIIAIATALPEFSVSTDTLVSHAKRFSCRNGKQERVLEELYRKTNINSRHSVLNSADYGKESERMFPLPVNEKDLGPGTAARMRCYEKESIPLATAASASVIQKAGIDARQITHLVTVSCTGFFAPGFDVALIDQLALSRRVERTHVGFMGCHGALNGIRVSNMIAKAEPGSTVLLCATELCTLHFNYEWNANAILANSLFADGAASLLCTNTKTTQKPICNIIDSASMLVPNTTDAMSWQIGDHGFHMHLSSQIPEIIDECLLAFIEQWLSQNGMKANDIANWAVHPGGPRILDAVERSLGLREDALAQSRLVLSECGNMSSPTVLFILERLKLSGMSGPTVMLGFGPGLTIEATLLELL